MGYLKVTIIALILILGGGLIYFFGHNIPLPLKDSNQSFQDNFLNGKTRTETPALSLNNPFERISGIVQDFKFENNSGRNYISSETSTGLFNLPEKHITSTPNFSFGGIINNFQTPNNSQTSSISIISQSNSGAENLTFPQVLVSELNISSSGAKTTEEYYKIFLETVAKIGFSEEDFSKIKKENIGDDKERPLLLEELIEKANVGDNLNELKDSFIAWHNFDETVITELKKMSVNSQMVPNQQMLIGWFKYHSQIAEKFSEDNLSKDQITQLANEFQKNAEVYNSNFRKSVSSLKKSSEFVFILKAEAFTCASFFPPGFYNFGGRVTTMLPCNWGVVETISPPCGGVFLFTYAVLAANPYLYKKPTYGSAILGRSAVVPGICILGVCPSCTFFPYEAIALYFGTSLVP